MGWVVHAAGGPARAPGGARAGDLSGLGQLAERFGPPPSEARQALALSREMTIAEAASTFGLTRETARKYSKLIYAKTGARGLPAW